MSRKTFEVTIDTAGRDFGKTFLLTEMSAADAEAWGIEALGVMLRGGMDIPEDALRGGMAAIATYGVRALFAGNYGEIAPLLARLMACVQIKEDAVTRPLTEFDIEEIPTRIKLRDEVIRLHVGFSLAEKLLEMAAMLMAMSATGGNSPTSDPSPEPLSPAASPRSRNSRRTSALKTPTTS